MDNLFWQRLDGLLEAQKMVIDRPKGSRHPRFPHIVFPLDYGYLEGTASMDGGGIDIWKGSDPAQKLTAIACTVDTMKKDSEIKLLIGCTEEETGIIEEFHNGEYMSAIIIRRPG